MKIIFKNPLPKRLNDRDALTLKSLNIKLRFIPRAIKGVGRLKNIAFKVPLIGLVSLFLLGYYPVLDFPPLRQSVVQAEDQQKIEISAESLPEQIILPHPGYLSTPYSPWHPGVDIATGLGMPIHPIASGVVEDVIYDLWGLGHHVIIRHSGGYKSTYGHMGRVFVTKGQIVTSSSIIGEVGLTGHTSGPHTHLEITKNDQYINPQTILPIIPAIPSPEDFKPVTENQKATTQIKPAKILKPDFS